MDNNNPMTREQADKIIDLLKELLSEIKKSEEKIGEIAMDMKELALKFAYR